MAYRRTQVYLRREHHAFLKKEAEQRGLSMTELLRCILDDYTQRDKSKEEFMQIVALGQSDHDDDISLKHDAHLAQALQAEHVR